jgi:DNA-directed RNA polymerase specialized sigma24 family protein
MTEIGGLPSSDLPFDEIYAAVQRGDLAAQELAVRRVLPLVVVAIQRRFRGLSAIDPDDAALSAFRTILRRGWEFCQGEERIDPSSWDQLAALCVRFAYNKARTAFRQHRRRKDSHGAEELGAGMQELPADTELPENEAIRNEMLSQVQAVMEQISEALDVREREILRGKLDGESSRQIQQRLVAQDIFLTESGIDKRWRRKVLPKLRELLSDGYDA